MEKKEREILASKLFFSKEAADFLGISVQRLNKLIQTGKIVPLKKNSSGTIFLRDELEKRTEELSIFEDACSMQEGDGMFAIDTPTKQEALNYATVMNVTSLSEKKLSHLFDEAFNQLDVLSPLLSEVDLWADYFRVSPNALKDAYYFAENEFKKLRHDDAIISIKDGEYPSLLKQTEEAPRFLYLRGNKALLYDDRTVALVGSREASAEGKKNTERVAQMLGGNGIIIVSGLAKGIDVTAHITALQNNFNTIAVIGTNLNQYYPLENKDVQMEIEKKGLIISQFSPATKTERWFFPLRNGVMSGISQATVIMEAGETSGALKQATFALKQKHLVLIPQNVCRTPTITWPEKFIKKGAVRVNSPKDIIEELTKHKVYKVEPELEFDFSDTLNNLVVAEKETEYSAFSLI